ncbi:MAG: hypothetical protein LPK19_08465 [Hymenobacteraceae bacterium]|nr:hypothetical protein [Hymenobacteraceae bacterium]MDX5396247.1 hypothetical protein [Hymenobacteraceae bacterium]MDX5512310.1 hypothetical protein [Hymenobacteraceae bacterium]
MIKILPQTHLPKSLLLPLMLLLLLLQSSCSTTRSVPEGDYLFDSYEVQVNAEGNAEIPDESEIKLEMQEAVRPKPNGSFLGLKFGLYIHNWFGPTKKEKGLKYWFKNKLGEPPVLLSQVDTSRISNVMFNELHNRGYFGNDISIKTNLKKKKATVTWTANVVQPYTIRTLEFPQTDSLPIYQLIRETQANSLLQPGKPYNLQVMIAERQRINDYLKDRGYYYFSPDFILFKVDSTVAERKVDVYVRIKKDTPAKALQAYTLKDIYIYTNYSISDTAYAHDTIVYQGYYYIPSEEYMRAKHLLEAVFLEHGELYSRSDQRLTATRLTNLGIFKFVDIDYREDTAAAGENKLNVHIFLTQAMKKSLRLEAQAVTKTNNFAGPGFIASFRNRNAFRGSELLTVNLETSYEAQVGGQSTGLNSYELGVNTALNIPRFVAPIKVRNIRSEFAPTTRITLGFTFLNRVQFFQMNSYSGTYSYNWKPKRPVTHEVTPINLQYVQLGNTTTEFDSILQRNTFLRRSFEQQFILG